MGAGFSASPTSRSQAKAASPLPPTRSARGTMVYQKVHALCSAGHTSPSQAFSNTCLPLACSQSPLGTRGATLPRWQLLRVQTCVILIGLRQESARRS